MARGRSAAVELQAEAAGAEAAEVPAEASEESSGPGLSLFDASGDARIRLLRRDDKTQKWTPHGYLPPDSTEETVLRLYGGGTYWSQLLVQTEAGREGIKQQRKFQLPGPYKPPLMGLPGVDFAIDSTGKMLPTLKQNVPDDPATRVNAGASLGGGDDLMSVLKAGIINTLLDMMKSAKEVRTAPAADPMLVEILRQNAATSQQMMQMQMKFMEMMVSKDGGDTKTEMLAMLSKMKELVAPPAGAPTTDPMAMFNTMLETFTRMRDVADDISPKTDTGGDPMLAALPKLVEVVAEQHQMQKAQRGLGPVVATQPTPGPAGGTAQMPVVGTIRPQPLAMWQGLLRQHAARLVASAIAKHDPDPLIGTAILFAPPHIKEALAIFFHREPEAVYADIVSEVPGLADHREWVDEFVLAAQERLFPEEFGEDADEGEGEPEGDGDDKGGR